MGCMISDPSFNERQILRIPVGTEGVHEARRHSRILRIIEDIFRSWGYLPVLTPVFDYYENYRPLLDRAREERICRFPDREGELLMLRSDITLFLAKQMGPALRNSVLPRRVYYADSIIRYENDETISRGEFFQVGAELIGMPGREGDLEVLMLLREVLGALRLPEWRLHIGSRAVLNAVLDTGDAPGGRGSGDSRAQVRAAESAGALLEIRDREGLMRLMGDLGLENAEGRCDLLLFMGSCDEFRECREGLIRGCGGDAAGPIGRAVEDLTGLTAEMAEMAEFASPDDIRIDLSEHGGQPYHTGFTMQAYVKGAGSAAASGGRYDELLGAFAPGRGMPAAGFSLLMRKIEPLSRAVDESPGDADAVRAEGGNFAERYRDARRKRGKGIPVVLS